MLSIQEFLDRWETSTQALLQAIKGVSPAQGSFKPDANTWSIFECGEHIVLTEEAVILILLNIFEVGTPVAGAPNQERIGGARIQAILTDRTNRYTAPKMFLPKNAYQTREALEDALKGGREPLAIAARDGKIHFTGNQTYKHPMMGELTMLDWVNFLINHAERHRLQIEEIKQRAGYPTA